MNNVKYVGMDVHKAITVIVILNALGQIESHSKVKTKLDRRIGARASVASGTAGAFCAPDTGGSRPSGYAIRGGGSFATPLGLAPSHASLKRWVRTVILVWYTADNKRGLVILATTDLSCTAADVLRTYQARFQLEFLFRDGKQHTGLTEYQARNQEALDFHFNASLATVSAARAATVAEGTGVEPLVFSLATQNQIAFNEHFMEEISTKLGFDPCSWKSYPAYE